MAEETLKRLDQLAAKAREAKAEDVFQNAREQAQAQFEAICEMVEALEAAEAWVEGDERDFGEKGEQARDALLESALSVEVRSGWHVPGKECVSNEDGEYRILLCTGGPAVQITGELSDHGEPETARLEMQDWFLPWTEADIANVPFVSGVQMTKEEILLIYARQFYFGE
jgi:hypothetical protein